MIGELVPVVMLPRFTSYLGEGTYTTVPLDVSDYVDGSVEFWRGKLRSGSGTFNAYFEEATEPTMPDDEWDPIVASYFPADASDLVPLVFSKKFFRIRIVLADVNHGVGITCWAAGSLQKRIPQRGNQ